MTIVTLDRGYSSPEVCRMAGVTYRQLDYWCRQGVLEPARPADGSGTHRRFSQAQIDIVRILGRLSALGVCMQAFRTAASELTDMDLAHGCWLVVAGDGSVELVRDVNGVPAALERVPEASWVIPLAA